MFYIWTGPIFAPLDQSKKVDFINQNVVIQETNNLLEHILEHFLNTTLSTLMELMDPGGLKLKNNSLGDKNPLLEQGLKTGW